MSLAGVAIGDIFIFPVDITKIPPPALLNTSVDMTITDGRIVYERH